MKVNKYDQDDRNTKFDINNIKKIATYMNPHKKQLFLAFVIGLIGTISILFIPKVVQHAIDVTFPNKNTNELWLLGLLILIMAIINGICFIIKSRILVRVKEKIRYQLQKDVFHHLQYLPPTYFDTRPHGKILTYVANYPENVTSVLCDKAIDVILELIGLIVVLIFMLFISVKITLFTLIFVVLFAAFFIIITPIRRRFQLNINNKVTNVNAYIAESINGIRVTQSFNREQKNESIFADLDQERVFASKKILPFGNSYWALTNIATICVQASIYLIGIYFFYPEITIGSIVALGSYATSFWSPIQILTQYYAEFMDSLTYLERIFELLDEPKIIENNEKAKQLDINGEVSFHDLSFEYIKGRPVLNNINFSIKAKEKIAFVGETGSGKTTMIGLIARYHDASSGEIRIDSIPIKDIDLYNLRSEINVMLQDGYIFSRTVLENLTFGKENVTLEEVIDICKKMKIHDYIMKLPKQYHTILSSNGNDMSTGQRQLLCLARTMIANPKILILDEATSNVDLKTEYEIQKGIELLMKDRTSIIIAHRLSTIVNSDRIFLLKNKGIAESGTHQELMQKKGEYYKLYTAQLGTKGNK